MTPPADAAARRLGYACAIGVLFIWSGFVLASRLSAQQALTAWDVAALRYAGAFLGAVPLALVFGWPRLPPLRLVAVVGTAAFGYPLFAYAGFGFSPAAHAGVLLPGILPFLTAALAVPLLGERWTRRRLLSLGVVGAGIALLAADSFGDHPGAWRGDLLFVAASCCWALYTVLVRRWGVGALEATLAAALWAAPLYLPVWWLLLPTNLAAVPTGVVLFQAAYQGGLAVLAAGFLFTTAVTTLGAARTTTIAALVPVAVALAAWPLLGEALGPAGLAGVVLVSAGIILGVVGTRAEVSPAPPRH